MMGDENEPVIESDIDSWCTTDIIRAEKGTFSWKIKGFVENLDTYKHVGIKSSEFPGRNSKWMLEINPKTIRDGDHLVTLSIKSTVPEQIQATVLINLVDGRGNVLASSGYTDREFDGLNSKARLYFNVYWGTLFENDTEYLPDGDLNFVCKVTTSGSLIPFASKRVLPTQEKPSENC